MNDQNIKESKGINDMTREELVKEYIRVTEALVEDPQERERELSQQYIEGLDTDTLKLIVDSGRKHIENTEKILKIMRNIR